MIFEEMLRDERAEGRVEGRTEESKETLLLYLSKRKIASTCSKSSDVR